MPVRHRTLVANAVTTVTFPQPYTQLEVVSVDGASPVYFRVGDVDPTIAGDDCEVVPSVGGQTLTTYGDYTLPATTVKLIAAAAVRVAVRAW